MLENLELLISQEFEIVQDLPKPTQARFWGPTKSWVPCTIFEDPNPNDIAYSMV